MAMTLGKTCQKVLSFISDYYALRAISPSFEEIGQAVGVSSSSTVCGHVKRLYREGYLAKANGPWGRKYLPAQMAPGPTSLDPRVDLAYQAGLRRGWALGCHLDEGAYKRALRDGFAPFVEAKGETDCG